MDYGLVYIQIYRYILIKIETLILSNIIVYSQTRNKSMSMSQHYGEGVEGFNPSIRSKGVHGQHRCCLGKVPRSRYSDDILNNHWYGWVSKTQPTTSTSTYFCEFCVHNYFPTPNGSELPVGFFRITPEFLAKSSSCSSVNNWFEQPKLVCSTLQTDKCLEYGIDRRCVNYGGMRVNINITDKQGLEFAPTMILRTENSETAKRTGCGIYPIPSNTYWEFVIKGDPNGAYNDPRYSFKLKASSRDGRTISFTNDRGNSNIYVPCDGDGLIVNSYKTGVDGERFFFVAPSKTETDHHLEAEHNTDSNVFKLTVEIYDMNEKPIPTQWRGGGGQTRGGGQPRGCTGGSNFGADGYSEHVKTRQIYVDPVLVDTVHLTLQLVNNESEEERIYQTKMIVSHIEENIQKEVAKTAAELNKRFPGYSWQITAGENAEPSHDTTPVHRKIHSLFSTTPTRYSHKEQDKMLV